MVSALTVFMIIFGICIVVAMWFDNKHKQERKAEKAREYWENRAYLDEKGRMRARREEEEE